jgi:hypothetical protein
MRFGFKYPCDTGNTVASEIKRNAWYLSRIPAISLFA